jgi:cytochrome c oxidase cbb3-type subunit II
MGKEGGHPMNNGFLIFLGVLITVVWSWYGIVVKSFTDFQRIQPAKLVTGETYPGGRSGFANLGQEVYKANGCASCHTMQVRMRGYGRDLERGWGVRNTVLTDFVHDEDVFLGQVRVGPDLATIGGRNPDRTWHLLHLYNPRITVPESLMPQYPYLFQERKISGRPSPNALPVPERFRKQGVEIIPTREAEALVEYMLSLRAEIPLLEAPLNPMPKVETNQTANAQSNAPAQKQ